MEEDVQELIGANSPIQNTFLKKDPAETEEAEWIEGKK